MSSAEEWELWQKNGWQENGTIEGRRNESMGLSFWPVQSYFFATYFLAKVPCSVRIYPLAEEADRLKQGPPMGA